MQTFSGAMPALITPFTARDEVNHASLRAMVDFHLSKAVSGFYLCGSTGEGLTMSVEERKAVVETVIEQVAGRAPVLVHVGSTAVRDAIDLAIHAGQHGAAAISSIVPPNYATLESLTAYFERLAAAVPDLPMLPYLVHPRIPPLQVIDALLHIPNFAGTKYTGPNMYEMREIIQKGQGRSVWSVLSGMDEQAILGRMMGAGGNIGSTVNLMPGAYMKIHALFEAGQLQEALDLQLRVNAITTLLISYGFMGALKFAMGQLGFDCGTPRLPGETLSEPQIERLRRELEQSEFAAITAM